MPRHALFLLCAILLAHPAHAYENESMSLLSVRAQRGLGENTLLNFSLLGQFLDGLSELDRVNLEGSLAHTWGASQVTAAYQVHFRRRQTGKEHRLWQQYRYRLPFAASYLDLRSRLEERWFAHNGASGTRLRTAFQWFKPVARDWVLSLGNEAVINLDDVSATLRSGLSQYRLVSGLRHDLGGGAQINLNYQLRFVNAPSSPNFLQHQVQIIFQQRL